MQKIISFFNNLIVSFFLFFLYFIIQAHPVLAVNGGVGAGGTDATGNVIDDIVGLLKGMIAAASVLMAVIGAYMYMTSGGNPERIGKAKDFFYSAAIGFIALAFYRVLLAILGI